MASSKEDADDESECGVCSTSSSTPTTALEPAVRVLSEVVPIYSCVHSEQAC
jgi:hypothetical protein